MRPFALVPRRRFSGVQSGERRSPERGEGDEAASSRPYRPGDRISTIDWAASARLSAARGADEFVVHEFFADRAPRVVVVCDRSASLRLYGDAFPWLDKAAAAAAVLRVIAASTRAAHGDLAYADATDAGPFWVAPGAAGTGRALASGSQRRRGQRRTPSARRLHCSSAVAACFPPARSSSSCRTS